MLVRRVGSFGQGYVAGNSGFHIAVGFPGMEQPKGGKGVSWQWLIPIRILFWLSVHSANIPRAPVRNPELYWRDYRPGLALGHFAFTGKKGKRGRRGGRDIFFKLFVK